MLINNRAEQQAELGSLSTSAAALLYSSDSKEGAYEAIH
jgi:hypothetical protein